ncbi:MAG TPA: ribonuclease HII, partial [Ktedonobacterales bacterium]
ARFLRDSKSVPAARRVEIARALRRHALAVEIIEIPVAVINTRGIGWANRQAFFRLISTIAADEYVVDGRVRPPAPRERAAAVRCLVKADTLVPAVSAASLIAKVHRDALMAELHLTFPHFAWDANAGYGTPAHLAALCAHGPSPHHRAQFVATALGGGQRAKRAPAEPPPPLLS